MSPDRVSAGSCRARYDDGTWDEKRRMLESAASRFAISNIGTSRQRRACATPASAIPVFDGRRKFKGYAASGATSRCENTRRSGFNTGDHDACRLPNPYGERNREIWRFLQARRYNRRFAYPVIDLDRFKIINRYVGMRRGGFQSRNRRGRLTQVLREIGGRLRTGGDRGRGAVAEVPEQEYVTMIAKSCYRRLIRRWCW